MFFYRENNSAAAFGSLGGITYTAKATGTVGNNTTITHIQGSAAVAGTKASLTISAGTPPNTTTFTLTARNIGTSGNIIIDYQSAVLAFNNTAQASYNAATNRIIVQYRGTPNISAVRTAINNAAGPSAGINYVVDVGVLSGTDRLMSSFVDTQLTGGVNAAAAETTAVTVGASNLNATSITVRIAAAETNIANVVSVINAAGTSVSASGTGSVTSRTGNITLSGGLD